MAKTFLLFRLQRIPILCYNKFILDFQRCGYMKKRLISFIFSVLIFAAIGVVGVSVYAAENEPATQSVQSVIGANDYHLNYNSQMAVGTKQQLQVLLHTDAEPSAPSFTSSNQSVATVSSSGVVTATGAGAVKITYSPDGNSSQSINITVKNMPTSVSVSATTKTLNEGQSFDLNARVNSNAYPCSIRYMTLNSDIVSVSSSGRVTARKEGKAVVLAIAENNVRTSCTVYVYSTSGISLNKSSAKIAMDYDNVEKVIYGTSVRGRDLEAYVINGNGNNSKTIFCTFAVHGFEDNYAHDGKVLVECANDLIAYFAQNPSGLKDYRIVIVPCANPDGTIDGKNNLRSGSSAFGRCTASHVDMNRDFISGQFKAQESRALRDLMKRYKMDTFIDFHGWLNSVLGNGTLVDIFRSTNGISRDQTGSYGTSQGYIFGWANANLGARSALVEFKSPSACNYLNVAKGIQQAVGSSYHPASSMQVKYTNSIAAVKNVTMTSNSETSISLKWDSVSGARGYDIQFYNGKQWESRYVFGPTSVTVSNLNPGIRYQFRIRAFTYSGNVRTYSNYFSSVSYFSTRPNAVSNFTASGRSSDGSGIILNWTQKLNADGYNLYQQKNGSWVKIAQLEGSMTANYRVATTPDTFYAFAIEAYKGDPSNVSARTQYSTYSASSAPEGFSVNAVSANTISASWNGKSGVGYYIQWATDSAFTKNVSTQYIPAGKSYCEVSTAQYSKNYFVRIRSCRIYGNEEIVGGYSEALSTANSLFRPENLNVYARGGGGTDLYLKWNRVDDANGYNIYIVSGSSKVLKGTTASTTFTFTDLTPSWEYDVIVEAYNGSRKTPSAAYTVCAAPAPLNHFNVYLSDSDSAVVTWDPASCHGYYIQWATDQNFTQNLGGTYTSNTLNNVDLPGDIKDYYFRARAWKWFGDTRVWGDYSAAVFAGDKLTAPDGYNVYARGDGGTDLYLDWNDVEGADGYRVYIVSGGTSTLKGSVTESTFVFTDLVPAWEYDVMVVAYNDTGSASSDYHICAAPASAEHFELTPADSGAFTASWDVAACHGYYIQWATDEDFTKNVSGEFITGSGSTSKTLLFEDPNADYYVRVRVWKWYEGSRLYGDFSEPLSTANSIGKPAGYHVYARGDGGTDLYLDWNDVKNADGYRVYIVNNSTKTLKGEVSQSAFVFTDLVPAWEYDVVVEAYNGENTASSQFRVCAAPAATQNFKVVSVDRDTALASWSVATGHGYYIQWATDAAFTENVGGAFITGSGSTSALIDLDGDVSDYYFRVRVWKWYENSRLYSDFGAPAQIER